MIPRLGDWVRPREVRNVTIGCGLTGWGPQGAPGRVIAFGEGLATVEVEVMPWIGMDRGKPVRVRTDVRGLEVLRDVVLIPTVWADAKAREEQRILERVVLRAAERFVETLPEGQRGRYPRVAPPREVRELVRAVAAARGEA